MTLKVKSVIKQNKNSHTQYLTIPSLLAQDSQYPFKPDEEVEIVVEPKEKRLIVRRAKEVKV